MQQAYYTEAVKCQVEGVMYDFESGQGYPVGPVTMEHAARGVCVLVETLNAETTAVEQPQA